MIVQVHDGYLDFLSPLLCKGMGVKAFPSTVHFSHNGNSWHAHCPSPPIDGERELP